MAKRELQALVAEQKILTRIYVVRYQKIMLDEDLAEMYRVETRRLNEQVKRNINRFPKDFMFVLTEKEYENLKSQNATSSWGGRRKLPNAFTEQGVAMLSSILNSDVAIFVRRSSSLASRRHPPFCAPPARPAGSLSYYFGLH
jgi:ORF6N domain